MLDTHIIDGTGSMYRAQVTSSKALLTNAMSYPPVLEENKVEIYREYMHTVAGATSMLVDGSATNVPFYVQAIECADRYISMLSFEITDAGSTLAEFGNLAALTNGCTLTYQKVGKTITIHNAIKTNWDLVRLCLGYPPFSDQTTGAFIAANVVGSSEGVIPILDFTKLLPPFGIKLDHDSIQQLVFTIRDDISTMDSMNAICYGFDRYV